MASTHPRHREADASNASMHGSNTVVDEILKGQPKGPLAVTANVHTTAKDNAKWVDRVRVSVCVYIRERETERERGR